MVITANPQCSGLSRGTGVIHSDRISALIGASNDLLPAVASTIPAKAALANATVASKILASATVASATLAARHVLLRSLSAVHASMAGSGPRR
jgi:hypothetical protein